MPVWVKSWSAPPLFRNAPTSVAADPKRHRVDILTDVDGVEFVYYGPLDGERDAGWHESWRDQTRMPRLVRVTVTSRQGATRWPPLVVAPRIDVDANCVLDLLTRDCRGR